jgi:hypothetical protein
MPIINGEMILPKKRPNLNQILFNGESNFEFKRSKIKKIDEINKDYSLNSPTLLQGKWLLK